MSESVRYIHTQQQAQAELNRRAASAKASANRRKQLLLNNPQLAQEEREKQSQRNILLKGLMTTIDKNNIHNKNGHHEPYPRTIDVHLYYKCYKLRGNPAKGGRYELGFRFGTSLIRSAACSAFWSWDRIFRGAANPIPASI